MPSTDSGTRSTLGGANPHGERGSDAPLVVVVSGPSGVGKDAVLARMKARALPFHFVVTVTTREPRPCEVHGKDYYFISRAEFERLRAEDALLEWAEVYGHFYGVPLDQVQEAIRRDQDVIIKADVQGAATIKRLMPDAVLIFLSPPSLEELACRLKNRKTETPEAFARRLATAERELQRQNEFDHVVVNHEGQLDRTVDDIMAIIAAERRSRRRGSAGFSEANGQRS